MLTIIGYRDENKNIIREEMNMTEKDASLELMPILVDMFYKDIQNKENDKNAN
jgi:hypothetical protein